MTSNNLSYFCGWPFQVLWLRSRSNCDPCTCFQAECLGNLFLYILRSVLVRWLREHSYLIFRGCGIYIRGRYKEKVDDSLGVNWQRGGYSDGWNSCRRLVSESQLVLSTADADFIMKKLNSHIATPLCMSFVSHANFKLREPQWSR